MGGPGKQVQVLPIKVCCTLALNRGARNVLEALGGAVPEAWEKAERIAANEANDEVCMACCCSICAATCAYGDTVVGRGMATLPGA